MTSSQRFKNVDTINRRVVCTMLFGRSILLCTLLFNLMNWCAFCFALQKNSKEEKIQLNFHILKSMYTKLWVVLNVHWIERTQFYRLAEREKSEFALCCAVWHLSINTLIWLWFLSSFTCDALKTWQQRDFDSVKVFN